MPIRKLFEAAEHVLTAVKPCWVMSPLVVAQVLPPRKCFDVVIFDEASQIQPADAVSALLRGRQAIVAGDPHQLPPTTFFASGTDEDESAAADEVEDPEEELAAARAQGLALTKDLESILDVMTALLPAPLGTRSLTWHYRSRDERLITFSNAQQLLYDWSMVTFPGAAVGRCLEHVVAPFRARAGGAMASSPEEVRAVVDLVLAHGASESSESIGVIALGVKHADAILELLRAEAALRPDVQTLLERNDEPLFVKNLERVQGDERDVIILSVGYGKLPDGRMRYNFGPINQQGGERRLNVAVTRARSRMCVVSSFSATEMDPARLHSDGAKMLSDYLAYAASGGANLGNRTQARPPLNAFELDIQRRLAARGIPLVPQYGQSGYWIDFAAMHPGRRSEPVLAIEADGASYHSSQSARDRDRLRQEVLQDRGWAFHRIWSTEWFRDCEGEVERAFAAYERAVAARDGGFQPSNGPPPSPQPPPSPLPSNAAPPGRGPGPDVEPGWPIGEYSDEQLEAVVEWVKSDGLPHTDDELLREAMRALGFQRRGTQIVARINDAIAATRS
jgi:very-short-patch-repair endonuclease